MESSTTTMRRITPLFGWVLLGLIVELAVFATLCTFGASGFVEQVSFPDSSEYIRVGKELAQHGTLPPSPRTPGYPLFLSGCFLVGGETYGCHVAIAVQLAVNLAFSVWFWFAVPRYVPQVASTLRGLVTALLFLAGLGLAVFALTDFLAGVLFALFLDGLICKRRWPSVALAGTCLFCATLIRPTFNYFPLLIPLAGYFAGRFSSKLPIRQMGFYLVCGIAAAAVSASFDYRDRNDLDSSGFPVGHTYYVIRHLFCSEMDDQAFAKVYWERLAAECGKPVESATRGERDRAAWKLLLAYMREQPAAIYGHVCQVPGEALLHPVQSTGGATRLRRSGRRALVRDRRRAGHVRPLAAGLDAQPDAAAGTASQRPGPLRGGHGDQSVHPRIERSRTGPRRTNAVSHASVLADPCRRQPHQLLAHFRGRKRQDMPCPGDEPPSTQGARRCVPRRRRRPGTPSR